jgi:hypothetical protein
MFSSLFLPEHNDTFITDWKRAIGKIRRTRKLAIILGRKFIDLMSSGNCNEERTKWIIKIKGNNKTP